MNISVNELVRRINALPPPQAPGQRMKVDVSERPKVSSYVGGRGYEKSFPIHVITVEAVRYRRRSGDYLQWDIVV